MYESKPGLRYRCCDITALVGLRRRSNMPIGHGLGLFAAANWMAGVTFKMTGMGGNSFPNTRMRRMRRDEFSRRLMRETHLRVDSLIYPIFVVEGRGDRQPVASMPGIDRLPVVELLRECAALGEVKIPAIALVPATPEAHKALDGRESWNPDGIAQAAVRAVKKEFP